MNESLFTTPEQDPREQVFVVPVDLLAEDQMLGGIYHPALRELCDNRIFLNKIITQTQENKIYKVYVSSSSLSKAIGQKRHNLTELERLGRKVKILPDATLKGYVVKIIEEETACT